MNLKHREAKILRSLLGKPRTIKEVAQYQRLSYNTAQRYLFELRQMGEIEVYQEYPIKYYIPLERTK